MTTVFDAAGGGSAKACWALMRRARADKHESASAAAKPSPFQEVASCRPEKPDRYWSAPRGAKRPVIPTTEIGYVRRSEISADSDEIDDRDSLACSSPRRSAIRRVGKGALVWPASGGQNRR